MRCCWGRGARHYSDTLEKAYSVAVSIFVGFLIISIQKMQTYRDHCSGLVPSDSVQIIGTERVASWSKLKQDGVGGLMGECVVYLGGQIEITIVAQFVDVMLSPNC